MVSSSSYPESENRPPQAVPLAPKTAGVKSLRVAEPLPATPRPAPARPVPVANPNPTVASPTPAPPEAPDEDIIDPVTAAVLEKSPPWLFSLAIHLLAIIVMALIVYVHIPRKPIQLNAELVYAEKIGDQLKFDSPLGEPNVKTISEAVITSSKLPPVDDPFAAPGRLEANPKGTQISTDLTAPQFGIAFKGRQLGSSINPGGTMGRYGGSGTTEAAVIKGLEWLARNQHRDGSWSLSGPFSGGAPEFNECKASATAMALLALQGNGNTHREGKFKKNVANGWQWLLKQQDSFGSFFQSGQRNHRFYSHGQCSIAICELYGMSEDKKFQYPAQQAINYCLRSQGRDGGWRYDPQEFPSDVSVTGWIVMALQSARMAGLDVPKENLDRVSKYLDSVAQHGGARYPYQRGDEVRLSMTAEALLMREYLGWKRNDPRLVAGVEWITSPEYLINFDNNRNAYFWYYAAQTAHHFGGKPWERWNAKMRQILPEQQVSRGKEAGSWDPNKPSEDQWGRYAGRLYVTCLSICMLEVYYRHMPIYSGVYSQEK